MLTFIVVKWLVPVATVPGELLALAMVCDILIVFFAVCGFMGWPQLGSSCPELPPDSSWKWTTTETPVNFQNVTPTRFQCNYCKQEFGVNEYIVHDCPKREKGVKSETGTN